jgi:RsiW-degrading membrane proteinase PrsW (M82 family)
VSSFHGTFRSLLSSISLYDFTSDWLLSKMFNLLINKFFLEAPLEEGKKWRNIGVSSPIWGLFIR